MLPNLPLRRVHSVPDPVRLPAFLDSPLKEVTSIESPVSQVLSPLFEFDYEEDFEEEVLEQQKPAATISNAPRFQAVDRSFSDIQQFEKLISTTDKPLNKILTLCQPTSDICGTLTQKVMALKPECMDSGTGNVNVHMLGSKLIESGYNVLVWNARTPQKNVRNALRNLSHSFIVCVGTQTPGGPELNLPCPLIIEPVFKEQFSIANPTEEFETLAKAVPTCFVGACAKLEVIVGILADEMAKAFEQTKRPLPPWRTKKAMLSKWVPSKVEELARSLVLQTTAGRTPERTLADGGGLHADSIRGRGSGPASAGAVPALTPFAMYAAAPFGDDSKYHGDQGMDTPKSAVRRQAAGISVKEIIGKPPRPISLLAQAFTKTAAVEEATSAPALRSHANILGEESDSTAGVAWRGAKPPAAGQGRMA